MAVREQIMSSSDPVDGRSERRDARELFNDALELPSEQRLAFLDGQCAGDPALRARVAQLLTVHDECGDFLAAPTAVARPGVDAQGGAARGGAGPGAPVGTGDSVGTNIGQYKLLERIGEGGFGSVYMAEQREPVQRRVALKLIKLGMDTKQVIARFEAERQALAMMDHPSIARVLDAGTTDTGRPYFVMELVRGISITKFCDEDHLTIRQRLELFTEVCHAVQHAHQKGIIHRDIKPSNVLVTRHDDKAVPKVIDFGVAKATHVRLTDKTLFTEFCQLLGTPAYMSPEQAQLSGIDIDTRSDIYSLGVLLYELLTGTTPFDHRTLLAAGYDEMRRLIREVEPPRPSTRISTLAVPARPTGSGSAVDDSGGQPLPDNRAADRSSSAAAIARHRHTEPAALGRLLRGDLDWIVMKCLEKDRTRRYETANDLAEDVQRHLRHEPVLAGPPNAAYKLRKFARRNRGLLVTVGLIGATLAVGLSLASYGLIRARQERGQALVAKANAEAVTTLIRSMLGGSEPHAARGPDLKVGQLLDEAADRLGDRLKGQPEIEMEVRGIIGGAYRALADTNAAMTHLTRALEICRSLPGQPADKLAQCLVAHAGLLDYAGAIRELEEALAIYRQLYGAEHQTIAATMDDLGNIYTHQGAFDQAKQVLNDALAMQHRLLGERHADIANSLYQLAQLAGAQEDGKQAELLYRDALAMRIELLGPEHPTTALNLMGLAGVLLGKHRFAEAIECFERALGPLRKLYGPESRRVAGVLERLATTYQETRQLDEAESYFLELMAIQTKLHGAESQAVAGTLNRLGLVRWERHDNAAAATTLRQSIDLWKKLAGDEAPDLASELNNLGNVLFDLGRIDEAEEAFRESLQHFRRNAERDASSRRAALYPLSCVLNNLADLLKKHRGDLLAAEQMSREALDAVRELHPGDSEDIAARMSGLAMLLQDEGKLPEAESLFRDALAMRRRMFGDEDGTVAMSEHNLAVFLRGSGGDLNEAEKLLRDAAAVGRKQPGDTNATSLAFTLRELGLVLYDENAALTEQEATLAEMLPILRKVRPTGQEYLVETLGRLASIAVELGRLDKAESLMRERLEIERGLRPQGDPELAGKIAPLVVVLLDQQRFADAEPLLRECLAIRQEALRPESPDYWLLANTRSMLGGSLAGQGALLVESDATGATAKLKEAEPLLLDGYAGLKDNASIPPAIRDLRIREALARIVKLYDAWDRVAPDSGYAEKTPEWRAKLDTNDEAPTSGPAP